MLAGIPYLHDSEEEWVFANWCKELLEAGIILEAYRPESWVLHSPMIFEYITVGKRHLLSKEMKLVKAPSYTADMFIKWNPDYEGIFYINEGAICKQNPSPRGGWCKTHHLFYCVEDKCIIDVKGTHLTKGHYPFSRTQQLLSVAGIFVQKIVPLGKVGLFKKTFAPMAYLFTRVRKQRRKGFIGLNSFLKNAESILDETQTISN